MREKIKIEKLIKELEISKSHLYRSLDKKIGSISFNTSILCILLIY